MLKLIDKCLKNTINYKITFRQLNFITNIIVKKIKYKYLFLQYLYINFYFNYFKINKRYLCILKISINFTNRIYRILFTNFNQLLSNSLVLKSIYLLNKNNLNKY